MNIIVSSGCCDCSLMAQGEILAVLNLQTVHSLRKGVGGKMG